MPPKSRPKTYYHKKGTFSTKLQHLLHKAMRPKGSKGMAFVRGRTVGKGKRRGCGMAPRARAFPKGIFG